MKSALDMQSTTDLLHEDIMFRGRGGSVLFGDALLLKLTRNGDPMDEISLLTGSSVQRSNSDLFGRQISELCSCISKVYRLFTEF
jgi:hypothetical protein